MFSSFLKILKNLGSSDSNSEKKEQEKKSGISPQVGSFYLYIFMHVENQQQELKNVANQLCKKLIKEDLTGIKITLAGKSIAKNKLFNMTSPSSTQIAGLFKINISLDYSKLPETCDTETISEGSKILKILSKNLSLNGGNFTVSDSEIPSCLRNSKNDDNIDDDVEIFIFGPESSAKSKEEAMEMKSTNSESLESPKSPIFDLESKVPTKGPQPF